MSRTYRRKKERPRWVYDEPVCKWSRRKGVGLIEYPVGSKEHTKRIREYHSDKDWDWSVPRSFVRDVERSKKMHDKTELIKFLKNPEYEPIFVPRKKDAGWYYW